MPRSVAVGVALVFAVVLMFTPMAGAARPPASASTFGPFVGAVTISSGCALSNAGAPISQSGSTFTLTGTLHGSLSDLCSGSTIDGAGQSLNFSRQTGGDGAVAVTVNGTTGVTVENIVFSNVTNGIASNSTTGLTLSGNTIPSALGDAIDVSNASGVKITNNTVNDSNKYSILAQYSSGVTISENNASYSFYGIEVLHTDGFTIDDNDLTRAYDSLGVDLSMNGNLTGNVAPEGEFDLWAESSSNVTFYDNQAPFSNYIAASAFGSTDVAFNENNLSDELEYSSYLTDSSDSSETGNFADDSLYGLDAENCQDVTFTDNNVSQSEDGFYLEDSTGLALIDNQAFGDLTAFYLDGLSGTLVSGNHAPFDETGVFDEYDNGTTVIDNDFSNAANSGVYSEHGSTNLLVQQNDLANATAEGVGVADADGAVTIENNDIVNAHDEGVYAEDDYGALSITDNTITNASEDGVFIEDMYGPVTLAGNDLAHAQEYGAYLAEPYAGVSVTGNSFYNDTEYGLYSTEAFGTQSIVDNNFSAGSVGLYADESYGTLNITNNVASSDSTAGIELQQVGGPTWVSGNTAVHSKTWGILNGESVGPVEIIDNDVTDSAAGILDFEPQSLSVIDDNDAAHSTGYGINVTDANDGGTVTLQDNNASGSSGSALVYNHTQADSGEAIIGNNFSSSHRIVINDSYFLEIVDNDLLDDSSIVINDTDLFEFYHNDVDSAGFNGTGSEMTIGTTWNAPYPIGGNYWTGYTGTDDFSGPAQNITGSDGIGDTPFPIPHASAGTVDEYPLMHMWAADPSILEFTATGLPSSTSWSVVVTYHGVGSGSTTAFGIGASPASVAVPFGAETAYSYTISSVSGYTASPSSGSGTTSPGATSTAITFSPVLFSATFTATGITSGTGWNLTINGHTYPSTTLSVVVPLANGTYAWTATAKGIAPVDGSAVVDGANAGFAVAFPSPAPPLPPGTYAVVFTESGISTGSSWSVTFDGTSQSSFGTTIVFAEPNGSYSYTVATTGTAAPQHPSGTFLVAGEATGVSVLFGSATGVGTSSSSSGPTWLELYAAIGLASLFVILATLGFTQPYWRGGSGGAGGRRRGPEETPPVQPNSPAGGPPPGASSPAGWAPPTASGPSGGVGAPPSYPPTPPPPGGA
ncbi:MAG: right-handed parallel beta-helix repeat-containing protein [Thermoplasmata archaeon]|nr:right-handed parallel beta-helix repeat-containing protein [Thermoplasmata archaeon]